MTVFVMEAKVLAAGGNDQGQTDSSCPCFTKADLKNAVALEEGSTEFAVEYFDDSTESIQILFVISPFLNRGVVCEQENCDFDAGTCDINSFPLSADQVQSCLTLLNKACPYVDPDTEQCAPIPLEG